MGLDAWARDTNGAPFSDETKAELIEFLDVTADGGLTWVIGHYCEVLWVLILNRLCRFKGFLQIYQLQTENDEEETWKDLVSLSHYMYRD